MKFSHSLQFNAVPEWSSKYIAYSSLKKLIYTLQRESLNNERGTSESSHLITNDVARVSDPSRVFLTALNTELTKIDEFYKLKEESIFEDCDTLIGEVQNYEQDLSLSGTVTPIALDVKQPVISNGGPSEAQGPFSSRAVDHNVRRKASTPNLPSDGSIRAFHPEDPEEYTVHAERERGRRKSLESAFKKDTDRERIERELLKSPDIWAELDENDPFSILMETRIILKKRIVAMYTTLSELKSYIELNKTGFKKALKKFDKSLNTNLKESYLDDLPFHSYLFRVETEDKLSLQIDNVIHLYSGICTGGNLEVAKSELSLHLREHVVWERNTVWRDMIGLERKSQAATLTGNTKKLNKEITNDKVTLTSSSSLLFNAQIIKLAIICAITITLLNFSPFSEVTEKNCFALLVCASLLWATESIPLFVTSLFIPLLIVWFGVLKNEDGTVMESTVASKYILSTMWSSVILLLLGGFTLAAALSKYHIAKLISTWILSKAGTDPKFVLLTIMSVALFASMWVSNVAAPVLCFSLIQPLLRTLPEGSTFANSLILGIALASNIGGMASPIASPQNMIAIGAMDPQPTWGQWFVIALPVCFISLILIWAFLLVTFKTNNKTHLVAIRTIDEKFTGVQWYIVFVSVGTIILWCLASKLEPVFGEMGIIAILPLLLFFGPGLLTTEDFNNYPWNIVILAMGGTALGKAVSSSGLLTTIALRIQDLMAGFSLFKVTISFGFLILIMATFVSHTVAALIIIPLVAEIGNSMPDPHPRTLIMAAAFLCSAAMGLPTSGFPNVTAICMTDEVGKPYLTVNTFITRGVPSSLIAYLTVVTVGYFVMRLIDF